MVSIMARFLYSSTPFLLSLWASCYLASEGIKGEKVKKLLDPPHFYSPRLVFSYVILMFSLRVFIHLVPHFNLASPTTFAFLFLIILQFCFLQRIAYISVTLRLALSSLPQLAEFLTDFPVDEFVINVRCVFVVCVVKVYIPTLFFRIA